MSLAPLLVNVLASSSRVPSASRSRDDAGRWEQCAHCHGLPWLGARKWKTLSPQLSQGTGLRSSSHEDIIILAHYSSLLFPSPHLSAAAAEGEGGRARRAQGRGCLHTWASDHIEGPQATARALDAALEGAWLETRTSSRALPGPAPPNS